MDEIISIIVIQVLLLSFQGLSYVVVQNFQGPYHDMERPLDKKIPLVTQAVYVYITWFPLIALYPVYLYICSPADYYSYLLAIILDIIISLIIYLSYPTSFTRPVVKNKNLSSKLLNLLYKVNYKGLNCMPSMHCSMCFIIIMSVSGAAGVPLAVQLAVSLISAGIVASTVLTKQHVTVDVISALITAFICSVVSAAIL